MAIHPYLFRLTPADTFFFGGERSFGYDGTTSNEGVNANYFVQSNRYPQQTTLLGVLRYKLLEANGWLATRGNPVPSDATAWIGNRSFRSYDDTGGAFGHIHALSPLFWLHHGTPYWLAPLDLGIHWQWHTEGGSSYLGQKTRPALPLAEEGYDPKKGLTRHLINRHGDTRALDEVYAEQTQEGIAILKNDNGTRKSDAEAEKEQGFYKQTYYRFRNRDWSFAFVGYLADEAAPTLATHLNANGWATLGGEGRPFRMTMEPVADVADLLLMPDQPATEGRTRLTLLSDACLTNAIYDLCDFAVSETVDFRAIETSTAVKNYANLNRTATANADSPRRSDRKHLLLERGSVFYVKADNLDAVTTLLDGPRHFRRIGYNAYSLSGRSAAQTLFTPNQR